MNSLLFKKQFNVYILILMNFEFEFCKKKNNKSYFYMCLTDYLFNVK